ncbi:MAG: hypothetical protein ABI852_07600 [Gemmatimonadaceae bacterium]
MSNRRIHIIAIAAISATAMLSPANASAQLGRLKKAAADAAKEKAGVKTDAPGTAASSNYVITADRLSAVMALMETSMAKAERVAAARAVEADYNKKKKAYESCAETQLQTVVGKIPPVDAIQKSSAITQQSSALGQRLVAAQQAKKYREYIAMTDTMGISSMRSALVMFNLEAKCSAPPYMPAALVDAAADKMNRDNSGSNGNTSGGTVVASDERAGMTTQQYGMVRERMALWALQQTNNAPADNNKFGVFTADEHAVLEAQGAKLKKWAPIFKDQPNTWSTWGDLKSW